MSNASSLRRKRAKLQADATKRRERYPEYGPAPLCRDHRKPMWLVKHYCGAIEWRCSTIGLDEGDRRLR